jgi:hypothetical protein
MRYVGARASPRPALRDASVRPPQHREPAAPVTMDPSTSVDATAGAVVESDRLHARVRAMAHAFERGEPMPETFDSVAADLARYQARYVAGYGRLCAAHGVDPARIEVGGQLPAVPTDAFKLGHVFAFDAHMAGATFLTSGTTRGAAGGRGTHFVRDTRTGDAVALAFGKGMLAADLGDPISVLVLGPSPAEAPDSSLGHMCALFARAWGEHGTRKAPERTFFLRGGALDVTAFEAAVGELDPATPAIVLATSFALVHLLDAVGDDVLALPHGSRVMQTGGFKGRSREVSADALGDAVVRAFAIDDGALVGEYGMTELSSQFWQGAPRAGERRRRVYLEPPWARVVPVHPHTLAPVPAGEIGLARIEDLANVDSAFAVVTQDRVRRVDAGFELLGRMPGAPPRGCSIAIEEMLSAGTGP